MKESRLVMIKEDSIGKAVKGGFPDRVSVI